VKQTNRRNRLPRGAKALYSHVLCERRSAKSDCLQKHLDIGRVMKHVAGVREDLGEERSAMYPRNWQVKMGVNAPVLLDAARVFVFPR
jgi:hypothetical protein